MRVNTGIPVCYLVLYPDYFPKRKVGLFAVINMITILNKSTHRANLREEKIEVFPMSFPIGDSSVRTVIFDVITNVEENEQEVKSIFWFQLRFFYL